MEDRDKITEQFKNAFQKSEPPEFAAMDKVWNRVEDKLDKKVLRKENKLWKILAVAASILLFLTLGYQFLMPDRKINNTIEANSEIVIGDTTQITPPNINYDGVAETPEERNPMIKRDAQTILKQQITSPQQVATADRHHPNTAEPSKEELVNPSIMSNEVSTNNERDKKLSEINNVPSGEVELAIDNKSGDAQVHKSKPLVVVDGKKANAKYDAKGNVELNVNPNDVEELVVLNEPLYIINGVHYSELDLFGPNPTSPYAPLNQQEIESISVLQGSKAVEAYGEKGKKGVVIIITKTGKPAKSAKGK